MDTLQSITSDDTDIQSESQSLLIRLQSYEEQLHRNFQKLLFLHYKNQFEHFVDISLERLNNYRGACSSRHELERNLNKLKVSNKSTSLFNYFVNQTDKNYQRWMHYIIYDLDQNICQ